MTNLFLSRTVGWRPVFGYVALLSLFLANLVQAANQQLRVQVIDSQGTPVPLLHVTLGGSSLRLTDAEGKCQYEIQPGQYVLTLDPTELANRRFFASGAETVVIADGPETVRFVLEPIVSNVKVSGRLIDDQGNDLDTSAVDIVFFAKGSNDSISGTWKDSEFSVDLYRGSWTVQLLVRNAGTGLLPPTALLEVCDDATVTNFNVVARRLNRFIQGTVVDNKGDPVPAAFLQGTGLVGNSSYRASVLANVRGEFAMTVCDGDWYIKALGFARYTTIKVSSENVSNVVISSLGVLSGSGGGSPNSYTTNAWLDGVFIDEVGKPVSLLPGSVTTFRSPLSEAFRAGADGSFLLAGPAGDWTIDLTLPVAGANPIQQRLTLSLSEGTNQMKILVPQRVHWITLHPTNTGDSLLPSLSVQGSSGDSGTTYTTTSVQSISGDLRLPVFDGIWTLTAGANDPARVWVLPPRRQMTIAGKDVESDFPVCLSPRPWRVEVITVDETGQRRPNQGSAWSTERSKAAAIPVQQGSFLGSSELMHLSSGLRELRKRSGSLLTLPPVPSVTPEPTPSRYCGIEYGPARLSPILAMFLPNGSGSTNLVMVEKRAEVLLSGWITNLTGSSSAALSLVGHSESGTTNYESRALIDADGHYIMRVFPGDWTLRLTGSPTNNASPRRAESATVEKSVSVPKDGATANLIIPSNPAAELFPTTLIMVNATENPVVQVQLNIADSRDRNITIQATLQAQETFPLKLPAGKALISVRIEGYPSVRTLSQFLSVEPIGSPNTLTLLLPPANALWSGSIVDPKGEPICAAITLEAVMKQDGITHVAETTTDATGAFSLKLTAGDWLLSGQALSLEQAGYRLLHRLDAHIEKGDQVSEARLIADPMPTDYLASEFTARTRPDGSTVLDLWHSYLGATQVEQTKDFRKWEPLLPSIWQDNTLSPAGESAQFYQARRQLTKPLF